MFPPNEEARVFLRTVGILCVSDTVKFTDDAAKLYSEGPWAKDTPVDQVCTYPGAVPHGNVAGEGAHATGRRRAKLFGRIARAIDGLQATKLHANANRLKQIVMLSAGGPGAGAAWTALPTKPALRIPNAE